MSKVRYLVDTNILIRCLSGEPVAHARQVRKLFDRAAQGEIVLDVPSMIVAETYYTLTSFYKVDKKEAAGKLSTLLQQSGVKLREPDMVLRTLNSLLTNNVGFADAYLAAIAHEEELTVASFDTDFDKLRVARYEPSA